jgi:hypothetical protein
MFSRKHMFILILYFKKENEISRFNLIKKYEIF